MAKDKRLDPEQVQRDLERFAAALKDSEKADKAAKEKEHKARDERDQAVATANAKAAETTDAKRELERAVEAVRRAKASGRGRAEADAAWKVAKARVIELETGTAPSWAPKPEPAPEPAPEPGGADDEADEAADEAAEAEAEPAD